MTNIDEILDKDGRIVPSSAALVAAEQECKGESAVDKYRFAQARTLVEYLRQHSRLGEMSKLVADLVTTVKQGQKP